MHVDYFNNNLSGREATLGDIKGESATHKAR